MDMKVIKCYVLPEEKEKLIREANEKGINLSQHIRQIICTEKEVIVIQDDDLREYAASIQDYTNVLRGILNIMKRSQSADIYSQDIERISLIVNETRNLAKKQLEATYELRKQVRYLRKQFKRNHKKKKEDE